MNDIKHLNQIIFNKTNRHEDLTMIFKEKSKRT